MKILHRLPDPYVQVIPLQTVLTVEAALRDCCLKRPPVLKDYFLSQQKEVKTEISSSLCRSLGPLEKCLGGRSWYRRPITVSPENDTAWDYQKSL